MRATAPPAPQPKRALATAAALFCLIGISFAAAPGLDAYRQNKFAEAYQQFEKTLKDHPNSHATDKIQFDAGAAAYEMGVYDKALEWFSKSLLSPDKTLQEKSHYNIGRTLEERADKAENDEKALKDLMNAQSHYEEALKLNPNNERAKANLEAVKKKIENLKKKPKEPPPSQQAKKQDQKKDQKKDEQKKDEEAEKQDPSKQDEDQQKEQDQKKDESPKPGESPSPSPGGEQSPQKGQSPSPSPDKGEGPEQPSEQKSSAEGDGHTPPSPTPAREADATPSPSSGSGPEEQNASPSAAPSATPGKKLAGEVKGAGDQKPNETPQPAEAAHGEAAPDGQMSEKQAELLLESMRTEEQRVQLDERKAARRVYNDW